MLLFGRLDFQLGRAAPIVGLWRAYRAFSHWGKVGGKAEAFSIAQKAVHVRCRIGIRSVAHAETMLLHITGTMLLRQVQTPKQIRYSDSAKTTITSGIGNANASMVRLAAATGSFMVVITAPTVGVVIMRSSSKTAANGDDHAAE